MNAKQRTRPKAPLHSAFRLALWSIVSAARGGITIAIVGIAIGASAWLAYPSQLENMARRYDSSYPFGEIVSAVTGFLFPTYLLLLSSELPFEPWQPLPVDPKLPSHGVWLDSTQVSSIAEAFNRAIDGSTITLGEGLYQEGGQLRANHVRLIGNGHVVLRSPAIAGKGAIVLHGKNTTIRNIECREVNGGKGSGACVRLQGDTLSLEHVYFHRSPSGLQADPGAGPVLIHDSRFELLGYDGRIHGIQTGNKTELTISNSLVIRGKAQGHEVSSLAEKIMIIESVIASIDGDDSRLLDLPRGGKLLIADSVLQQGPNTRNQDMVLYGTAAPLHSEQTLTLINSVVILEAARANRFLRYSADTAQLSIAGNTLIGRWPSIYREANTVFKNRESAKLPPYPAIPDPATASTTSQFETP